MQITLSFDNFTELPYTSGTIQNISSQATVEICQDDTVNSGLILGPGEWFSWSNSTIYARSAWDYEPTAICAVVPFKKGEEGGGGSEYILPVASKSTLGGVKSSDEAGAIKVDGFGKMTYNSPTVEPISAPDWETGTTYPANALVTYNGNVYLCLTAHTSGIFADDLANGKWKLVSMTLSVATSSKLGGVKSNSADGGVTVDSDGKMTINLPKASSAIIGGIKVGSGLSVTADGTLSATGGGGGSWQQVVKLNVTAPIDVKIDIPYTDTFISPPVEVLKYISGTSDVTVNEFTFDGGDGSRFEVDGVTASESPLVTFDGVVKPNHDDKYPFGSAVKMVNKYYAESAEIDLDAFKIVSEVSLI